MKRLSLYALLLLSVYPFIGSAESSNAKYTDEQMLEREYSEIPATARPRRAVRNPASEAGMGFGGLVPSEPAVERQEIKPIVTQPAPVMSEPESEPSAAQNRILMGPDY